MMTLIGTEHNSLVFIPAAGLGTRVSGQGIAKPLIPIGGQPLIWRIMDLYPNSTRFVVTVGHEGQIVSEAIEIYGKSRGIEVEIVWTDSHLKSNGGLSGTLRATRPFLQEPFIFHAVDSLLDREPGELSWLTDNRETQILLAKSKFDGSYRVDRADKLEKKATRAGDEVYIGIARVQDWELFWHSFSKNCAVRDNEEGEAAGLDGLLARAKRVVVDGWFDAGNPDDLRLIQQRASSLDNVLPKRDEDIWHRDGRMVKVHKSEVFIANRVKRASALMGFTPECKRESAHIFSYERSPGNVLSKCNSVSCFQDFLFRCSQFWSATPELPSPPVFDFISFYKTKTIERVQAYLGEREVDAAIRQVNGFPTLAPKFLLDFVPWDKLLEVKIGLTHGDLHPENVIHNHSNGSFTFLDWRQDVAGSTSGLGDIYYDLAKILHGLIVDHGKVLSGKFSVENRSATERSINIDVTPMKRRWLVDFFEFLEAEGLDADHVWLLTGLIFLNIATLHHNPYDEFLFSLGLLMTSTAPASTTDMLQLIALTHGPGI